MTRPALARLVDLANQLDEDAKRSPESLRRRDRALAAELVAGAGGAEQAVVAWLDRVRPDDPEGPGERAERANRVLGVGLGGLGLGVGMCAAAALFHYDGTHPVNVVRVLAVFVGLQLGLVAVTLLATLPERLRRAIPGLGPLRDAFLAFSPGRWRLAGLRFLPARLREASQQLRAMLERQHRLYGEVEKWWLLAGSQWFGVSFNVGALTTAFFLVAFTDLAFAWSTTLDLSPERFLGVVSGLAAPWSALWPGGAPTAELVAQTQYFRAIGSHSAAESAPWWRFLLACMLVYGLVPRLALLVFARWRLAAAVARAFRRIPGVMALRDRLESRLVETAAETEEIGGPTQRPILQDVGAELPTGAACHAIVWSGFPLADARAASRALGLEVRSFGSAGEGALENDARAMAALTGAVDDAPVLVVTKAWEPPVLELLDFIGELRAAVGEERAIVIAPLMAAADGNVAPPSEPDASQWRRAVDRLGDPWTSVYLPAGEAK
jgi:hypothetical protein